MVQLNKPYHRPYGSQGVFGAGISVSEEEFFFFLFGNSGSYCLQSHLTIGSEIHRGLVAFYQNAAKKRLIYWDHIPS